MHIVEKEFKDFINGFKNKEHFFVAYSGGVDSQVLLYLSNKYIKDKTTALHVNHGISDNAQTWTSFCEKTSKKYGIVIKNAFFKLKEEKANLEEKARELRYDFFKDNVKSNQVLMTGHHLDDQAETFILRLMRGSGVDGLASMQPVRPFHSGELIRPLLNVSKEDIIDFANSVNLEWVEDESNKDTHYDRNFIRNEVMPLLRTRWNHANKAIARSAKHCQKHKEKQEKNSKKELTKVLNKNNNQIDVLKLIKYSFEEQKSIVREWLKSKDIKMPDEKALNSLINEVVTAKSDTNACFEGKTYQIRKSFNNLFFVEKNKKVCFNLVSETKVQISFDKSNKRMLYKGQMKKLKVILKEEKVPNWEREYYPIYLEGDNILSLGDIKSDFSSDIIVKKYYN